MILVLRRGGDTRVLRGLHSVDQREIRGTMYWLISHNREAGNGIMFTERYMLTYDIAMVIQAPRADSPRFTFLLGDPRHDRKQ